MNHMKTKILIVLGAILIMMGVGYAVLMTTLTIRGTSEIAGEWNVYISDIKEKTLYQSTTLSTKVDGKTTASFNVDLEKPGSYAEYEVTVKNDGNLDAVLKGMSGIDEANALAPTDIEYSVQDLAVNTPLPAKAEIKFVVRVDFKLTATSLNISNKNLTLYLDFEQSDTSSVQPTPEPTVAPTPTPETYPKNLDVTLSSLSFDPMSLQGNNTLLVPSGTGNYSGIIYAKIDGQFEAGHEYEVRVSISNPSAAVFDTTMSGAIGLYNGSTYTALEGSWIEGDYYGFRFVVPGTATFENNNGMIQVGMGGTYFRWTEYWYQNLGNISVYQLS